MVTIRCQEATFENIQAILFDKDGTLANVEGYLTLLAQARARCVKEQLSSVDGDFEGRLLSAFGCGDAGNCRGAAGGLITPTGLMAVGSRDHNAVAAAAYVAETGMGWIASLELVETAFQNADKALPVKVTETPPLEGMTELLQSLRVADVNVGIVSSDLYQEVASFIDTYAGGAISWYCGAGAPAGARWLPKTHPDFLQFACEQMSTDPASTLVIGDSAADLALSCQGAAGFIGMIGGWSEAPKIDCVTQSLSMANITSLRQVEVFE
ncbi:MAG: HAD family hydrolase [Cyanobacteria bacterium P01_F01_bin.53]